MSQLRNIVGKPVRGDDFVNREKEIEYLERVLDAGNNVLLTAPRRVGKTSVLLRVADRMKKKGWVALYADASGVSELQLVTALGLQLMDQRPSLPAKLGKKVREFYERIRKVGLFGFTAEFGPALPTWQEAGDALMQSLSEAAVIVVDEIAVFLMGLQRSDKPTRAEEFLRWMERWRRSDSPVRWVLTGSIGLDTILHRARLASTIRDLLVYDGVGAFSEADAHHLLEQLGLAEDMPLEQAVRQRICDRIGWRTPFFLQLLFSIVREEYTAGSPPPEVGAVDEAYRRLLLPSREVHFAAWEERLREQLGPPDDRWAAMLLDAVAASDEGLTTAELGQTLAREVSELAARTELLGFLIRLFENDGYLARDGERHVFRSPLLRDVWRARSRPLR